MCRNASLSTLMVLLVPIKHSVNTTFVSKNGKRWGGVHLHSTMWPSVTSTVCVKAKADYRCDDGSWTAFTSAYRSSYEPPSLSQTINDEN